MLTLLVALAVGQNDNPNRIPGTIIKPGQLHPWKLTVGEVGELPESRPTVFMVKVRQIVSKSEMVVEATYRPGGEIGMRAIYVLSGVNTEGLADGKAVWFPGTFRVKGTQQFTNLRTLYVVEYDPKATESRAAFERGLNKAVQDEADRKAKAQSDKADAAKAKREAASRAAALAFAKKLLGTDREKGRQRLEELAREHPGTAEAKEAAKLLGK